MKFFLCCYLTGSSFIYCCSLIIFHMYCSMYYWWSVTTLYNFSPHVDPFIDGVDHLIKLLARIILCLSYSHSRNAGSSSSSRRSHDLIVLFAAPFRSLTLFLREIIWKQIKERERPGFDPPTLGLATPLPHSMKVKILNNTYRHPCECELNGHSLCVCACLDSCNNW